MRDLAGKVALVTGASRNIGRAIALRLAREGCGVILNSSTRSADLEDVASLIRKDAGGRALAIPGDIASPRDVERIVAAGLAEFGTINILVNNAVLRVGGLIHEISLDDWQKSLAVNLTGPFLLLKRIAPLMMEQRWGRIVSLSGIDAFRGAASHVALATVKMGLVGMTRGLATDLGPYSVTANVIAPGWIDTERAPVDPDYWAYEEKGIPAGRMGTPEEVAAACAFLCSEEASFINGQTLSINGGQLKL